MRILYYNWDHIDGKIGGGVTIYQKNVLSEIVKNPKNEVFFLNSGYTYDNKKLRIEETENSFGNLVSSYEIINSPVLAPVTQSCRNLHNFLTDTSISILVTSFLERYGPFDVIHFNNLEGLSLEVLSLKTRYPNTKFIYSVHNYFPICSRVNLWKDEVSGNGHNCDKCDFSECVLCYRKERYMSQIIRRRSEKSLFIWRKFNRLIAKVLSRLLPDKEDAVVYKEFELRTIQAINENVDVILAVSQRVKDIMINHGIEPNKVLVSYIGTKVAEHQYNHCNCKLNNMPFSIIYMGYMDRAKGFYFLLDVLEEIPKEVSQNVSVRIVARYQEMKNRKEIHRLKKLRSRFAKGEIINGYTHDNQKFLLNGMNLGIVPVLWEDNLPQVAIEQVAYGVPILVSDIGGTQEIVNNDNFIFRAGDKQEFIDKLIRIIDNRQLLDEFWTSKSHLITIEEHINELQNVYEK